VLDSKFLSFEGAGAYIINRTETELYIFLTQVPRGRNKKARRLTGHSKQLLLER